MLPKTTFYGGAGLAAVGIVLGQASSAAVGLFAPAGILLLISARRGIAEAVAFPYNRVFFNVGVAAVGLGWLILGIAVAAEYV